MSQCVPQIAPRLHQQWRKLHWRIDRRYQTITAEVQIGPVSLHFTRVADPDTVLDRVAEAEDLRDRLEGRRRAGDELHLPYWAELWDSALGMSNWLIANLGAMFPGRVPASTRAQVLEVLDLGCGMGMTGAVAAAMGCRVLFADLDRDALLFARLNSLAWAQRVRTRQLNWRTTDLQRRFDLIIGADILYERAQWQYLEPFWRAHLRGDGTVLLGEPGRATGDYFLDWIGSWPWRLEQFEQPVPTRPRPIRIFRLTQEKHGT